MVKFSLGLLLLASYSVHAAEFEGTVFFDGKWESIADFVPQAPEQMTVLPVGEESPAHKQADSAFQIYYFKRDRFRVVYNDGHRGSDELFFLNTGLFMQRGMNEEGETFFYSRDAREPNVELVSIDSLPVTKDVLERSCQGVEMVIQNRKKTERKTTIRVFFDPALELKGRSFRHLGRNAWKDLLAEIEAVPLHLEIESWRTPGKILVFTAREIIDVAPDDADVELQEGAALVPR